MAIDLIDIGTATARLTNLPAADLSVLAGYITAASRAVESYCHRVFGATDFVERYSSDGGQRLFLRNRPVLSIASITTGRTNPITIDPDRYDFNGDTGEVMGVSANNFYPLWGLNWGGWQLGGGGRDAYGYGAGFLNVTISYRAGYEPGDIPADVAEACLLVVQAMIQNIRRNGQIASETLGPHSITYVTPNALGLIGTSGAGGLLVPWVTIRPFA